MKLVGSFARVASGVIAGCSLMLAVVPARAQSPPKDDCEARQQASKAQEARDSEIVKAALATARQNGIAGLKSQPSAIQDVLDRAPASFEAQTCDGADVVRADSSEEMLLALLAAAHKDPKRRTVVLGPSPYPAAALVVGSWYVENGDWVRAEAALNRGLALAPRNPKLTSEQALTLSRLGRYSEAIAVCDRTLTGNPLLHALDRARILRTRGYALGELKRYDDAEAAYRESLKYEPNHAGALHELTYLAQQRAGSPPTRTVTLTSDKAKVSPPRR